MELIIINEKLKGLYKKIRYTEKIGKILKGKIEIKWRLTIFILMITAVRSTEQDKKIACI